MRLISHKEAEFIEMLSVSLRLKSKHKIIEHFHAQYQTRPEDPEMAFNYGICLGTYTIVNPAHPFKQLKYQLEAYKALSTCLQQRENWWLARFVRIELLHSLGHIFFLKSQSEKLKDYTNSLQPEDEVSTLIDQQNSLGEDMPYFFCPYLLQSYMLLYKNETIEAIEFYKKGLEQHKPKQSRFKVIFLVQPFCLVIDYLRRFKLVQQAEEIKHIGVRLFPKEPSLLRR